MDVSVIIVNYNTCELSNQCIASIKKFTHNLDYEIILVDNASTDGSKDYFSKKKDIKYIFCKENLGFGRANNLGYSQSLGKYILLLNSDTVLINDAINQFYNFMEECDNSIGCCGGFLLDCNHNITHSYGSFPSSITVIKDIAAVWYSPLAHKFDTPVMDQEKKFIDYITGADLFIRRSVVEKCGLFDPDYFLYYEETDLQKRFHDNGYLSVIIKGPQIIHLQGASTDKKNVLVSFNRSLESKFLYYSKHFSCKKRTYLSLLHLSMIPRILFVRAPVSDKKTTIAKIINQIKMVH